MYIPCDLYFCVTFPSLANAQHGCQDCLNITGKVLLLHMVRMFKVLCFDWFRVKSNKTNMVIMTISITLFCVLLQQQCITGSFHKMATEQRKVNIGSLTNSGKDVAPFLWLTSAATSSHAAAPALYQEDLNFWFETTQTKSIYDKKNLQHSPRWSAKNCPDEKVWDSNLDKIFVSWG